MTGKRTQRAFLLLIAALLAASSAFSQPQYRRFSTNDGLAQNFISSIVQDRHGFLWFGTFDGLSRYDGYTFRTYRTDPSDPRSLAPGFITALHVASDGLLWVGFMDGAIDLFDPSSEQFHHLAVPEYPTGKQKINRIAAITEERPGVHWAGTEFSGLLRIDDGDPHGALRSDRYRITRLFELAGERTLSVGALYTDRSGRLWVQTTEAVFAVRDGKAVHSTVPASALTTIASVLNCRFDDDSAGRIWFVSSEDLFTIDGNGNAVSHTDLRPFWSSPKEKNGRYLSVTSDVHTGERWITLEHDLLRIVRGASAPVVMPRPRSGNGLTVAFTTSFVDESGSVWFGTKGYGLYQYHRKNDAFGLMPGVSLNAVQRQFKTVAPGASVPSIPSALQAYAGAYSFRDRQGIVWGDGVSAGDHAVLRRRDPSGRIREYPTGFGPQQVTGPYYPKFIESGGRYLWIVNYSTGVDRYDRVQDRFDHFQIVGEEFRGVSEKDPRSAFTTTACADIDGAIWIGTESDGLFRLDTASLRITKFSFRANDTASLAHRYVITICPDPHAPERYLWVGTYGGGLCRLDKTTGMFRRFNERSGLPSNVINAILPDRHGNLWISSNHGLWRLEPRALQFRSYDTFDGLQGLEFNRYEAFAAPDGRMFFGGTEGANVFDPDGIMENGHIPSVVFTDLKVRNRSVVPSTGGMLTKSITHSEQIEVPSDVNVLTFEFAALDFSNPRKNLFSTMMQGFEKEWSAPSTKRTVTYTNLDPGEYTLIVRGSNDDGVWNMEGARMTVVILPPWYRTWWAYLLYIILIVTALLIVRRYELRRIRLKDELALQQSRTEQLQEVDRMKMRFFQNISHEFRTPLTLILGPLDKLLARVPEETERRDLRTMRRNANRLLRLINQLLDISKLEAGGMALQASRSDLIAFVRGVTMSFHSLAERKEIFLDISDVPGPLFVYFDRDKLEKVLVNLLGNAFKFTTENGEVQVLIGVEGNADAGAGEVSITVRDTGIGITPEKLPHIFDRFYQADAGSTRAHEGTGIGLSLVKELVSLHRGTVTAESRPGEGSRFIVRLKLGRAHLSDAEIVESPFAPAEISAQQRVEAETETDELMLPAELAENDTRPLLLVIEDHPDVRAFIRIELSGAYRVAEAFDGGEGIARAKELVPDLVISDVMMPVKDGYEVCAELKQTDATSHIPVILLTAKAASKDRISGLETGADDYLVKPFESAELLVRVKNLIENRRRLREKFGKEVMTLAPDEIAVTPKEQVFLARVKSVVEERMSDENFTVEQLADALHMSYTQLHRKLKAVTDLSANQFIRSLRLQRAMAILKQRGASVSETAYQVGFSSPSYFTKCFAEQFGIAPSEVHHDARVRTS